MFGRRRAQFKPNLSNVAAPAVTCISTPGSVTVAQSAPGSASINTEGLLSPRCENTFTSYCGSTVTEENDADILCAPTACESVTCDIIKPVADKLFAFAQEPDPGQENTRFPEEPENSVPVGKTVSLLRESTKKGNTTVGEGGDVEGPVQATLPSNTGKPPPAFTGLEPLDRANFTMADLIVWNPKNDTALPRVSLKNSKTNGGPAGSSTIQGGPVKTDSLNDSKFVTPKEPVAEIAAPQLKVGADGQIIIDETSLVIEQTKVLRDNAVVDETGRRITSHSFRRRSIVRTKAWTTEETDKFYVVLSATGPDFGLMQQFFPKRSRVDLKRKFKKEEMCHRGRIDKAFKERRKLDASLFELISDESDGEADSINNAAEEGVTTTITMIVESLHTDCAKKEVKPKVPRARKKRTTPRPRKTADVSSEYDSDNDSESRLLTPSEHSIVSTETTSSDVGAPLCPSEYNLVPLESFDMATDDIVPQLDDDDDDYEPNFINILRQTRSGRVPKQRQVPQPCYEEGVTAVQRMEERQKRKLAQRLADSLRRMRSPNASPPSASVHPIAPLQQSPRAAPPRILSSFRPFIPQRPAAPQQPLPDTTTGSSSAAFEIPQIVPETLGINVEQLQGQLASGQMLLVHQKGHGEGQPDLIHVYMLAAAAPNTTGAVDVLDTNTPSDPHLTTTGDVSVTTSSRQLLEADERISGIVQHLQNREAEQTNILS